MILLKFNFVYVDCSFFDLFELLGSSRLLIVRIWFFELRNIEFHIFLDFDFKKVAF